MEPRVGMRFRLNTKDADSIYEAIFLGGGFVKIIKSTDYRLFKIGERFNWTPRLWVPIVKFKDYNLLCK